MDEQLYWLFPSRHFNRFQLFVYGILTWLISLSIVQLSALSEKLSLKAPIPTCSYRYFLPHELLKDSFVMAIITGTFGNYSTFDSQSMLTYQIKQNDRMILQNEEIIAQIKSQNQFGIPDYMNLIFKILQIITILVASGFIYFVV